MPLPKIADARRLSDDELVAEIAAAKRKLFELRFQRATQNLEKTHEFKHARHWIAQLLTVERERQLAELAAVAQADAKEAELAVAAVARDEPQSPEAEEE